MDRKTLRQLDIETLLRGFVKSGKGYACLYCDALPPSLGEAEKHMAEQHRDTPFLHFFGASSLLHFTHAQRVAFSMKRGGAGDEAIATALNTPKTENIRSMLRNARNAYDRAKAEVIFYSTLFPPTQYERTKPTKSMLRELVPWLEADRARIGGFLSKAGLHEAGIFYHTTLIILIDTRAPDPVFIVGNKADKKISRGTLYLFYYDTYGGHVSILDILSVAELAGITSLEQISDGGRAFDPAAFDRCCVRELDEELPGFDPALAPPRFWRDFDHDGRDPEGLLNREWTRCYVLPLADTGLAADAIQMREKTLDSLGKPATPKFPTRAIPYSQLMEMYRASKERSQAGDTAPEFADGLARVLDYFEREGFTGEDVIRMVREAKPIH